MAKLTRDDLYSLEKYAEVRADFRAKVIEHKKNRRLALDEHNSLYFEDALTVQYQIQEMLRIERIFEAAGIAEELAVYNPMIPDGHNWKATFMIEYADETERKAALARMIGVEDKVWLQVAGFARVYAIADEDLERGTPDKTASVHFMRFELTPDMIAAAKAGAALHAGIEHPACATTCAVPDNVRAALANDLT
ncbi:MAG: hypothetical protein B7Y41_03070 [Hydrogenophilales bacterium 28-61-23]|nr:MAG: hypothetical protein B7Y41_03070 [Hydrogenophilales bacterium 28-61-23]